MKHVSVIIGTILTFREFFSGQFKIHTFKQMWTHYWSILRTFRFGFCVKCSLKSNQVNKTGQTNQFFSMIKKIISLKNVNFVSVFDQKFIGISFFCLSHGLFSHYIGLFQWNLSIKL